MIKNISEKYEDTQFIFNRVLTVSDDKFGGLGFWERDIKLSFKGG